MSIPINGKLKPRNDTGFALLNSDYIEYNSEKLSDALYKYLYVTNIQYGELSIRKVYLGETLIWQCDIMTGSAESTSYTQGGVYKTIALDMSSEVQNVFDENAEARVLEVTLLIGKEDSTSMTNSFAHLGRMLRLQSGEHYTVFANAPGRLDEVVCMNTNINSDVYSNSPGRVVDTHQMGSSIEVKQDELAFTHVGKAIKSTSNIDIKHSTSSAVTVSERIPANGHFVINFVVNKSGATVADAITAESNVSSQFVVTAVGGSNSPISTQALAESTSATNSVASASVYLRLHSHT